MTIEWLCDSDRIVPPLRILFIRSISDLPFLNLKDSSFEFRLAPEIQKQADFYTGCFITIAFS
jgi:hypothetical protein